MILEAALLAGLDRGGVDRSAVATLEGVGSGMSVAIFDAEGDYGAVIVSGSNLSLKPTQAHDELLRSAKVLILQNEIPEEVNEEVARRAGKFGVKTILNAAPARAFETALPGYVDILVVNALEAEMLGSAPVRSLADAEKAAESLDVSVCGRGCDRRAAMEWRFKTTLARKSPFLAFRSKCKAHMVRETCS